MLLRRILTNYLNYSTHYTAILLSVTFAIVYSMESHVIAYLNLIAHCGLSTSTPNAPEIMEARKAISLRTDES